MLTEQELQEMQARCDAATPGPWVIETTHGYSVGGGNTEIVHRGQVIFSDCCDCTDTIFVSRSRTDLPRLIAAYREQAAELAHYKRALEWAAKQSADVTAEIFGNATGVPKGLLLGAVDVSKVVDVALDATKEAPCPKI